MFFTSLSFSIAVERHKVGIAVGHDGKMVRREPRTSDRLLDSHPEALIHALGFAGENQANVQPLSGDYSNYPQPDGAPWDNSYPNRDHQHGQVGPHGQDSSYPEPFGSYPRASPPYVDGPMNAQPPQMQGNVFGPLNEVEARREVEKMDRIIAEAEFRAGLPDTTHTTPPPEPGEDPIEQEERTGMYIACLIVLVLVACAAGYSLHKFQGQKAEIDAAEDPGEARTQEEDEQVPQRMAAQS